MKIAKEGYLREVRSVVYHPGYIIIDVRFQFSMSREQADIFLDKMGGSSGDVLKVLVSDGNNKK